uniref:Phospholipase D n=1 Tax=Elaeis guineensis var. tenera TaxID=51953 RepID=A0A6I9QJY7_ELAGV|nr:phospholipase D alpha 4 [Elaeis guineensis]
MEERKLSRFLHGTLEVTIFRATVHSLSLPFNCICFGAKPAYVTIKIDKTRVAETSHQCDRVWNQTFRILCAHLANSTITLTLRTSLFILGKIEVPLHGLLTEAEYRPHEQSSHFLSMKEKWSSNLKLQFALRFRHVESELDWGRGLRYGGSKALVNGATFPQRSNCSIILYHDAHHCCLFQPRIDLRTGRLHQPRKLWEDIFRAIDGAKHLIYITGWSLNPKIVLVRDSRTEIPRAWGVELGELLKRKADEGVAVRIMLWDDETSLHIIKNKGVMRTHDEDALSYFKHTKVVCKLCPRLHNNFPTFFAHHQKTITVDACPQLLSAHDVSKDDTAREVISFIGGLDLCDGRYDTEQHSLFQSLNTNSHADDFYQTSIAGASLHRGGPRQPWHDAHACVIGEAARDVLANFEQRWAKQSDSSLLPSISRITDLIGPQASYLDHSWNVQVFRSIDRISAAGLPDHISVEHSIHDAYIQAIRRAERFIYIENQYFMGGCHLWEKDQHSGCKNLIPVEIALKVAAKIRANERFAVYILMPMWPEGLPETDPVQDMLHWTRLTISMMYALIARAIKERGANIHPKDYLNFFCLANREEKGWGEFIPPSSPPHTSHYFKAQMNRRFMIYVHSKLMIVDDEYMLIGSANVNQRSMDGERDTEIAVGCYQPNCVGEKSRDGDIHAYRMSLWYEHTSGFEEAFMEPQSISCVRSLQGIGEEMWKAYSGEAVIGMKGVHLVSYPINVLEDGTVEDLPEGAGSFPDTTTPIKGRRSKILPSVCTT